MGTSTTVVIIGAGPSGLTLGVLLRRSGVPCVVLEARSRTYVENRQRAGVVEHRAGRMFADHGLADALFAGVPLAAMMELRIDGMRRYLNHADLSGGHQGRLCPQQTLVRRLIALFEAAGGDLRFEAADVTLSGLTDERVRVRYRDRGGHQHELSCEYLAGCDGFHGVSRASIPAGEVCTYAYDQGIGWLTILAESPPPTHPLMAISRYGFAAQFYRGPDTSRFYLQIPPGDGADAWPAPRIWEQIRLRLYDQTLPAGRILDVAPVDMRSVMHEPMSYGRLYLVGDAAHIVPPLGGKGMNMALFDADTLADALRAGVQEGDPRPLREYSAVCLRRAWEYQEFCGWLAETVHDAGDPATCGPFRHRVARARLERIFTSPAAAGAFAELMSGVR